MSTSTTTAAEVPAAAAAAACSSSNTNDDDAPVVGVVVDIEANLQKLGITIDKAKAPPKPTANYVSCVRTTTGSNTQLLHFCGHNPQRDDGTLICGTLGKDVSIEEGYEAAKWCAINILYTLHHELNGDWSKVKRIVKVVGFVNSTSEFVKHPLVINGASDLFVNVFGPAIGQHARSAVGMISLPWNIATEVECIIEIYSPDSAAAAVAAADELVTSQSTNPPTTTMASSQSTNPPTTTMASSTEIINSLLNREGNRAESVGPKEAGKMNLEPLLPIGVVEAKDYCRQLLRNESSAEKQGRTCEKTSEIVKQVWEMIDEGRGEAFDRFTTAKTISVIHPESKTVARIVSVKPCSEEKTVLYGETMRTGGNPGEIRGTLTEELFMGSYLGGLEERRRKAQYKMEMLRNNGQEVDRFAVKFNCALCGGLCKRDKMCRVCDCYAHVPERQKDACDGHLFCHGRSRYCCYADDDSVRERLYRAHRHSRNLSKKKCVENKKRKLYEASLVE